MKFRISKKKEEAKNKKFLGGEEDENSTNEVFSLFTRNGKLKQREKKERGEETELMENLIVNCQAMHFWAVVVVVVQSLVKINGKSRKNKKKTCGIETGANRVKIMI